MLRRKYILILKYQNFCDLWSEVELNFQFGPSSMHRFNLVSSYPSNTVLVFVKIKVVILFLKLIVLKFAINHFSALLEAIIEAAIIFQGWVKVVKHDFFNSNYGGLMRHK
jgi:hypothetical protein